MMNGRTVTLEPLALQPEELEVLEPRDRVSVSEWAGTRRKLSAKTSDLHGDWSNAYTPFLVEVMDSLSDPGIHQVTLGKCAQGGGTEASLNFLGWAIEEAPGPMLLVMPREEDVNRRVATRIRPMFESTHTLLRHLDGRLDKLNIGTQTELDNMIIYLAWSTSPAALADNPICYIVLDEVGKFPAKSGREADPVSLAKDRQRTFFSRSKLFVVSTPVEKGDLIDREYHRGDCRQWWVRCPYCGHRHVMRWAQVELDKTPEGKLLTEPEYLAGGHARYRCPECTEAWDEQDRWAAVTDGIWAAEGCTVDESGRIRGRQPATTHRSYRVCALMLHPHFMTIDRLAAQWADAQEHFRAGDVGPLQDFINSQLAEPWVEIETERTEDQLLTHVGYHPAGVVPPEVVLLTAGIDIQIDHAWMIVLGWGYLSECWIIYDDRIETGDTSKLKNYASLRRQLQATFQRAGPPAEGREKPEAVPFHKVAIDCNYRKDLIFDFCRQCREIDIVPVRGDPSVRALSRRTKTANTIRYDLNTNAYKDRIERLLAASSPGPGYMHLHRDASPELLAHLTAEDRQIVRAARGVVKHVWKLARGKSNHLWDCAVYATFAGDLVGARLIRDPDAPLNVRKRRAAVMDRFKKE